MKHLKLIVVDDHPMLRSGIVSLFEDVETIEVTCEAKNGSEALKCIENNRPDVVLMDINIDGQLDLSTTETIKERWPEIKVLAFSMHEEVQVIRRMVKAGASGYLLKSASHQEVLRAIRAVGNGETYYGQQVLEIMTQTITSEGDEDNSDVSLSNREREVLHYVAKEFTNQEIAEKINISLRTVETHKRNLIKKLRVKNVVGLVRFALEQGPIVGLG
ncbi:MAG: response regulator transcription factor [Flavobacteriales bacterium]|nr:response regulator transcription factor [Flavobacteriales bacterium]